MVDIGFSDILFNFVTCKIKHFEITTAVTKLLQSLRMVVIIFVIYLYLFQREKG